MNRSFLIIFVPAVFVAAMYVSLGIYPPARVWVGIALFATAVGMYRVRAMMHKRGKLDRPAPPGASSDAPPVALPAATAAPAPSEPTALR
jgi:hypothetical protein